MCHDDDDEADEHVERQVEKSRQEQSAGFKMKGLILNEL